MALLRQSSVCKLMNTVLLYHGFIPVVNSDALEISYLSLQIREVTREPSSHKFEAPYHLQSLLYYVINLTRMYFQVHRRG